MGPGFLPAMNMERVFRRGLIVVALAALGLGIAVWGLGHAATARWIWASGTVPVAAGLAVSMTRDVLAGRIGVDAIALVSMSAALLLGETLAGIVVAVMYAGGNVLEDFAVARAERDLKSLVDRAPRVAHRRGERGVEDISVEQVTAGATPFWCAPARSSRSTASSPAPSPSSTKRP